MNEFSQKVDGGHLPVELDTNVVAYRIWKLHNERGKWKLTDFYWNEMVLFASSLGIYLLDDKGDRLVLARSKVIEAIDDRRAKNLILDTIITEFREGIAFQWKGNTIQVNAHALQEKARRQLQKFWDQNKGNVRALPLPLIHDTRDTSYLFFKNGIVTITKDAIQFADWENAPDGFVWDSWVIPRSLAPKANSMKGMFEEFLENVCDKSEEQINALTTAIGYLLHKYTSTDSSNIILLLDKEASLSNVPQGGTGKGLICQALQQVVRVAVIDGKQFNPRERFAFQIVDPSTVVIQLDDVQENFKFDQLFSASSEGVCIEKKQQTPYRFPKENSPKFIITSNQAFTKTGKSYLRRFHVVHLAPFYSNFVGVVDSPILHVHGSRFFSHNWSEAEWNQFYWFIFECIQLYLRLGLGTKYKTALYTINVERLTSAEFAQWLTQTKFQKRLNEPINELIPLAESYAEFQDMHPDLAQVIKQQTFTKWLIKYFKELGYKCKRLRKNGGMLHIQKVAWS
jgi:hypothetical protein